ncbi:MAG: transcription-repair coupling factor, partial [Lachnospiraceae bacterium]|nr:transcription-repair coupling factor [Lachnospiraceae bacterium]
IAAIESPEEREEMQEELKDRFGTPPPSVDNLLRVSTLRSLCHRLYVTQLTGRAGKISIRMRKDARLKTEGIQPLIQNSGGSLKLYTTGTPEFVYTWQVAEGGKKAEEELLEKAEKLAETMKEYLMEGEKCDDQ